MDAVRIFGIPVARLTEAEAVERIIALARERKGGRPAQIATLNVDFVANAVGGRPFRGDAELWNILKNADLVTADGMPIVLLSRLLGKPLPERVTGADMVPALCRRCAEEGMRVYVLGGDKAAVEKAFENLGLQAEAQNQGGPEAQNQAAMVLHPGVPDGVAQTCAKGLLSGIDTAFVKPDEDQPEIAERINAAAPDILFVALGNPKQELWMSRNAARLRVGAMIGIGGTFNFIAGKVKRAPRWMQRCGLEWIYRIAQEPGRLWKRYAYGLVKFGWLSILALCGAYRERV